MSNIISAIVVLGVMGAAFGLILAIASKVFAVETDERLEPMIEALPGANCGGCGYTGCAGYAQAVLDGTAPLGKCAAGGQASAEAMAKILGVEAVTMERMVAKVMCSGKDAAVKGSYDGITDCLAATKVAGRGPLTCDFGCLGFGNCVKQCQYDAIHVIDGKAVVDREKCVGCMSCAAACPRGIIKEVPYAAETFVPCSSKAKGPVVLKACGNGCIGCMKCTKVCENDAIHVVDALASIDYSKCVSCGKCVEACPRKLILTLKPAAPAAAPEA